MNSNKNAKDERKPETWQARYEASETGWDRGEASPALLSWISRGQLKPCRIVVPGCGNGHEVVEPASRGFDVTAVDFAATPVNNLNERLASQDLTATVVQQDFFTFEATDAFDVIYEQTCLCAIDPRDRDRYADKLASCLRPGGQLFALFMQSGDMESGPPFPCNVDEMKKLFDASTWEWATEQQEVTHPTGHIENAVILTRKERAS